jgi:dTMP kinase
LISLTVSQPTNALEWSTIDATTDHGQGTKDQVSRHGIFITLEGIDGAGKSTQFRRLVQRLRKLGYAVCATREPGGTRVGERIRSIVLASTPGKLAPLAELALIYAARAQLLEEVVGPALVRRGEVVVSDRYNDASLAYQGYGRQLGVETVRAFDRVVCGKIQPNLTIVLDLDPRVSLARARGRKMRRNSRPSADGFEAQGLRFQERVRAGYLAIAARDPQRVKVVRGDRPASEVQAEIGRIVDEFLKGKRKRLGARV